jgi:hypothetical protein
MSHRELPGFDTLRELAEHHPEQLEQLRRELTEELISSAPPRARRRLRGLQFQLDARRRLAPNPVAACIAVSGMMHEALQRLQRALNGWPEGSCGGRRPGRVLPFHRRPHPVPPRQPD